MTPAAQPAHLVTSAEHAGRTCPYCRFAFKAGLTAVQCGSCRALHHAECWQDNGGCTVMGCPSAPAPMVSPATPPPVAAMHQPVGPAPQPAGAYGVARPAPPVAAAGAAPSAAEFAEKLRVWAQTPIPLAAAASAGICLAVMLAVGFVVALLTPDSSLLGIAGGFSGLLGEAIRDTVATTQAGFGTSGFRFALLPLTFAAVPIAGAAFGAHRQAYRTAGLTPAQRVLVGAATGVPLAVFVLVLSAFAGDSGAGFSPLAVLAFCLLWAGIGGVIGVTRATGTAAIGLALDALGPQRGRLVRIAGVALKPLAALLLVGALVGLAAWEVQIVRGEESARFGRSAPVAILESPFMIGQYAVQGAALAALTQFEGLGEGASSSSPLPFSDGESDLSKFTKRYRVFAYSDVYPAPVFVFVIVLLLVSALLIAVYAGYATAAVAGAREAAVAAGYGALVGPLWALALVLLRAIGHTNAIVGGSLFASALLLGAAAGAVGGLLAARGAERA